ncbi:MAG: S8 family serine peptidase, partial [Anaerolineae bacterium]
MSARILLAALAAAVFGASVPAVSSSAPTPLVSQAPGSGSAAEIEPGEPREAAQDLWIVVLEGEPLASYAGGVSGLQATSPKTTGTARLDVASPDSVAYLDYLTATQDDALLAVEGATGHPVEVLYRYQYATNGFAVRMTPDEAARVSDLPGVVAVEPNTLQPLDTDAGPQWIGAPAMWDGSAVFGGVETKGEGVIVGVVDTGINMDHPSFAATDEDGYTHTNPKGEYLGFCNPSHPNHDSRWKCNDKLIGVYSFLTGAVNQLDPEDDHDHGSHTASTAAGNAITLYRQTPTTRIEQRISGVAPHANIIAYDACFYQAGGEGSCPPVATLKALDQALADGVDVINYSISTSQGSPWRDSHMLAFKRLREAGIVASVSAGNDGPGASTVRAAAPWVLSVAAARHGRFFSNAVSDFSGGDTEPPAVMQGGGMTGPLAPTPIVYAGRGDFVNVDGEADDGRCARRFPAGTFNGEIVVCNAGGSTGRVQRGSNVQAGGAGGMVLANEESQGESIASDSHLIPAVHIGYREATELRAWLGSGEGHTARIEGGHSEPRNELGGALANFSSRGPAELSMCCLRPGLETTTLYPSDVIKPDLTAPGVDILAAYSSRSGRTPPEFGTMSGTSMAAPHMAGAAALLKSAQPDWTPAEIQSALTLTAVPGDVRMQDDRTAAGWFDEGAGRADVGLAARSGLVMDISDDELDAANPELGGQPRDLNLSSLGDANCLSSCSWRRTLRNPLDKAVTWTAFNETPDDMALIVRPARFKLEPGAEVQVEITANVEEEPYGNWVQGDLLLQPNDSSVPVAHMPVAVRAVRAVLPPMIVESTGNTTGTTVVEGLRAVEIDELHVDVHGLQRGDHDVIELPEDPTPTSPFDNPGGTGSSVFILEVGGDAERLVAEIAASEAPDVDLYVGRDDNGDRIPQERETVCLSGSPSWEEYCTVEGADLTGGTYWVLVQNFTASADAPDQIAVVTALVTAGDEGNLKAEVRGSAEDGQPFDMALSWDLPNLQPSDRWLGIIELGSSPTKAGDLGRISVDLLGVARPVYMPFALNPVPSSVVIPSGRGAVEAAGDVGAVGAAGSAHAAGSSEAAGAVRSHDAAGDAAGASLASDTLWTPDAPLEADPDLHIVLLRGEPLAGYVGGLEQLAPTSPLATGADRLDVDSKASVAYLEHLEALQAAAVASIESAIGHETEVVFRYKYATNGLAVRLSAQEAKRVANLPEVLAVEPNTLRLVDTDAGPTWIGAPGVWDGSAMGRDVGSLGEGVVVGVIDTGINMDHPSFAEVDERGYEHVNPRGEYLGQCNKDDSHYDRSVKCNDKLIGVHSFLTTGQPRLDPEDDHGHGSHTASTAAGNFVTAEYRAPTTTIERTFSGVAPHANIVAYDACYNTNGNGVCPPTATLAALDQALVDGVDVINYSIATGSASPWADAHALAFKRLRDAGVVAAVSAGNDGPGSGTTNAISPWVMAVGAATHDRYFGSTLTDLSGGDSDAPDDARPSTVELLAP